MSTNARTTPATANVTKVPPRGAPLLPSEVDVSCIDYSDLKQMGNVPGAKSCYVNYNGGNLMLELPWMQSFGIRQPPAEYRDENAPPKYTMEFTLKGYGGDNPEVKALYDCMMDIRDRLVDDSVANSMQWHKKKSLTPEAVDMILNPLVKMSDTYDPSFKVKVPYWEGEWKCDVFKSGTRKPLEGDLSEQVCGRIEARAIVQCAGLWFVGGKFGVSWKLKQMEYRTFEQGLPSGTYAFRDPTPISNVADDDVVKVDGKQDDEEEADDTEEAAIDQAEVVDEDDVIEDSDVE